MEPLPLPRLSFFVVLALACFMIQNSTGNRAQRDADQAEILNCIKTVIVKAADNGYFYNPGFIHVTESKAFPILKGNDFVNAGGRIGKGRVFGAGAACMFNRDSESERNSDTIKFADNVLGWVNNGNMNEIAVVPEWTCDQKPLRDVFKKVTILRDQSEIATTKADVILIDGDTHKRYAADVIRRAEEGKGILVLANNWSKAYSGRYADADSFNINWAPNIVARAAGFRYRFSKHFSEFNLFSVEPYKCLPG